jgi:prevent-host-death family protein
MITVSISEAKAKFEWLVDQAESGIVVTITKWGKPVAQLVAITEKERRKQLMKDDDPAA